MKVSITKSGIYFVFMAIMLILFMVSFCFIAELIQILMENPIFALCVGVGAFLMPLITFAVIDRGVDYE